jgi:acylphosphatase
VAGWASNLADGSVEVVARGTPSQLSELDALLARGPGSARVDAVERVHYQHQIDESIGFEIK